MRTCDICGKELQSGYVIADGESYCEDCLREGLKLLKARDEVEELRQPFYVIDTPMGHIQTYNGKPMAFKKKIVAEWQIQETERLMRKNGFSNLCGIMFIRPMTLERCGKAKHHFIWLDKTIGEMKESDSNDTDGSNQTL